MKKTLYYWLIAAISLCSCAKRNAFVTQPSDTETLSEEKTNNLMTLCAPTGTDPVLTGSFVDFWSKGDWTQTQWNNQLQEMKDIGITTAVIQFTGFDDGSGNSYTWFNSANTFTNTKFPNALGRLLTAASAKSMDVYIGLYFHNGYWTHQVDTTWLKLHADRCDSLATEINTQFGSNTAFKGWYIPHEPEPYAYNTATKVGYFKNALVNRISNYTHTLNNKPVALAAFFNDQLSTSNNLLYFMKELGKCNVQVIMLQDGIGVGHASLSNIRQYYNDANWGLYHEGNNYQGLFWSDLETFNSSPAGPASISRVVSQLDSVSYLVHKNVSFQYYTDMSASGPYPVPAAQLRSDYITYLNSLP